MTVLHVIAALDARFGGPGIALAGLAKAQRDAGMQVKVVSTWVEGDSPAAADELRALGIELEYIGPARPGLRRHPQIVPTLEKLISECDVVHIHALYEEIQHLAAQVARKQEVPYLFSAHGMLTSWSLAQSRLKKKLYMLWRLRNDLNRASAIHFTTQAERESAAHLKLRPPNIVEPLGVDLSEFRELPPRGTFRNRYPQLAGKRIVVFLGRIHHGKGLELLVPAFAKANLCDAMLVIVGPDFENFQASVESMIREHNIADRVIFTGMLHGADRIAALADADLFALPSFHENFGIAVIEALAAGVPVIISDEVNVCREIAAAQVGAVIPTKVEPLVEALQKWLGDDALRAAAAARAKPFVEEHYDWSRIAHHWHEHYAALTPCITAS